jgi:hypothetical protein
MKQFTLAAILLSIFTGYTRADVSITFVTNQVSGEMYISGYVDDYKSITGNTTGPYSASAVGSSGTGSNLGNYSSALTTNIAANGSTIVSSGTYSAGFTTTTAALLAGSAYSFQEVDFTVGPGGQVFTLNGSMTNGNVFLFNSSTNSYVFIQSSVPTTTLSYFEILDPGTYEFAIQAGVTFNFTAPPSTQSSSGGFDIQIFTSAPEPSSLALVSLAGLGIAGRIWRWRRAAARKQAMLEANSIPSTPTV